MAETEADLLRRIAEQQQRQIQIATEALELQQRHMARIEGQMDRAERIQARAEGLQLRASKATRVVLYVLIPLIVLVAGVLLAPYFRYWLWLARH